VPADARLPARGHLGLSARAKVQRQASGEPVATENQRLPHLTDPTTISLARLKGLSFSANDQLSSEATRMSGFLEDKRQLAAQDPPAAAPDSAATKHDGRGLYEELG
jgi:hypothetical protein